MARRDSSEFLESFAAIHRTLRAALHKAYAGLELGTTQAKFLRHVGKNGRMSQADLARATETDPTLTGRALQTLFERGWMRRKRSEEDRREYILELGAAGQRAYKRAEEARAKVAAKMMDALDDRDLSDFERIAKKVRAAFEDE